MRQHERLFEELIDSRVQEFAVNLKQSGLLRVEIACRQIDKLTPAERQQLKEML